ncbi:MULTISPECIES: hypothetical protein [Pseudomonas]|uniref:hypothetical protein n=1 Tax=Pseudomonas TaxID=286 RepID=UPI00099D62E5|nr:MULTISPECIES: hypothetical protein [Pseudomonas]MCK3846064.1 hypothetical protein [Pseudomonas sp. W15Feb34]OPB11516.1 hypothetical protein BFW89_00145 [Pseudomonas synxantha]
MKRLIPRDEIENYELTKIESPYFARIRIREFFRAPYALPGLRGLLRECNISPVCCSTEQEQRRVIDKLAVGDWLFVTDRPFLPLSRECRVKYGYLMGQRLYVGPGKWEKVSIDYDGIKNTAILAANRLVSAADEGRVFLSDGKDLANTTRVMTQRWVRLDSRDDQLTHRSVERRYGELRHIKQRYLEGDDNWQVGGKSWHWQPVTPDVVYEYKEAGK